MKNEGTDWRLFMTGDVYVLQLRGSPQQIASCVIEIAHQFTHFDHSMTDSFFSRFAKQIGKPTDDRSEPSHPSPN